MKILNCTIISEFSKKRVPFQMCSLIKRIKELIMQTLRQFTGDYDYTSDDFKPLLIYYKLHKKTHIEGEHGVYLGFHY